jgi:hypothetical protein
MGIKEKDCIGNIECSETDGNLLLNNSEDPSYILTYHIDNVWAEEALVRIIKAVEKLVRQSEGYYKYIGSLRETLNTTRCSFIEGCTEEDATIEFHHYPFTLFEIVEIIFNSLMQRSQKFSTPELASIVLQLHYDNLIGLVPLSVTAHQLAHSGKLFINMSQVFGYVGNFVALYETALSAHHIKKYNSIIEASSKEGYCDLTVLEYLPR